MEKQFHNYYTRPRVVPARPVTTCCSCSSAASTTWSTAPASPGPVATRVSWSSHGHFKVNGKKVDIPSYQVSAHDVIDVREKSLEMTPFIVARETHGERVVPAWLEAIPSRMRVLVHQLPVRAQIDLPVQEQLIVEYYSKK